MCCFFKQKTAYEMRIRDWSSDVCSSDLKVPPIKASSNRIEHENRRLVFLRHARLHLHADPNVFGSHAFDPAHQPWPFVEVYQRDMIGRGRRFAADDGDRIDGDRKSVVEGKSVAVRVGLGGRRIIKKKKTKKQ